MHCSFGQNALFVFLSSFLHQASILSSHCHVVTHCSVLRSLSCPLHHSLLPPHLFIPTHQASTHSSNSPPTTPSPWVGEEGSLASIWCVVRVAECRSAVCVCMSVWSLPIRLCTFLSPHHSLLPPHPFIPTHPQDGDLYGGTSGPSKTYDNPCLASAEDFECLEMEVWGMEPVGMRGE